MGECNMDFKEYQKLAARTINTEMPQELAIANFCMGLAGEAGETIDHLKKALFHGHEASATEIVKELGDVLWYVAGLASVIGLELDDIAVTNIAKLMDRYPEGFNAEDSLARKDVE